MKNVFLLAGASALFLALASTATAQQSPLARAVVVKDIDFDNPRLSGSDEWIECVVELEGGMNPDPDARNPRFVDNIRLRFYTGFELAAPGNSGQDHAFFTNEVEIATLEQGETASVRFFIPPQIKERDRLSNEPKYYLVEIEINGVAVPTQREHVSSSLGRPELVTSFKGRVGEQAAENEGIMVPIYDTLFWDANNRQRSEDMPAYRIKRIR